MPKALITAVLAAATLSSSFAYAQPMPGPHDDHRERSGCYRGEDPRDCRERLRVERRGQHRYVWRDGRYEREDDPSVLVLGFILGQIIAGPKDDRDYYDRHRNDRGWRARCRSAYRSFDYRTGTYVGRDGYRHYCVR